MVLGGSIVDADVHLAGVVVKVNARDVVWIVVVVGGLALPLHLCSNNVPSHVPLVDFVVGIVSRVNIAVVHVGIVDASGGRRAAGARAVGSRAKVLAVLASMRMMLVGALEMYWLEYRMM